MTTSRILDTRERHEGETLRFFVPAGFDADAILPPSLARYRDCAHYMIHRVVTGRAMRQIDENGYVRLKVAYLRKVIPWRIEKDIRDAMIGRGALTHDPHYTIGDHAMGYGLGEAFRDGGVRRIECADTRLAARVMRLSEELYRTDTRLPVHRHLRSWLGRVEIDAAEARRIVASTPDLAQHADLHLTLIDMIRSGHVEFSYCRQGRVHSLITRMARDLRPTLSIDGEPLTNIDISNSQPLILASLTRTHPTPPGAPHPPAPSDRATSITMPILSEVIDSTRDDSPNANDVNRYVFLCESGRIYDHLWSVAGLDSLTRDQVKVKFYCEIFFGRNQVVTDFTRVFEREFPTVMRLIRDLKRRDYTRLARDMQRQESRIIIHGACAALMREHPDIPLITIHDSVMTTLSHVETVRQAMMDAFAAVGLRPTLKMEGTGRSRMAA